MTKVVHRNKDSYDISIDRSTIFSNPFEICVDGTRLW